MTSVARSKPHNLPQHSSSPYAAMGSTSDGGASGSPYAHSMGSGSSSASGRGSYGSRLPEVSSRVNLSLTCALAVSDYLFLLRLC